jgi:hypothetical protein
VVPATARTASRSVSWRDASDTLLAFRIWNHLFDRGIVVNLSYLVRTVVVGSGARSYGGRALACRRSPANWVAQERVQPSVSREPDRTYAAPAVLRLGDTTAVETAAVQVVHGLRVPVAKQG